MIYLCCPLCHCSGHGVDPWFRPMTQTMVCAHANVRHCLDYGLGHELGMGRAVDWVMGWVVV